MKKKSRTKGQITEEHKKTESYNFMQWGSDILSKPTKVVPISRIKTPAFKKDVEKMFRIAGGGVGLAANQIGLPWCMAIVDIKPTATRPYLEVVPPTVLVNPEIIARSKELQYGWEGCWSGSKADVLFYTSRPKWIKVSYLNDKAEKIIKKVDGFAAIVFEHEISHLYGQSCGEKTLVVNGKVAKGAIITRDEYMKNRDRVPEGARELLRRNKKRFDK